MTVECPACKQGIEKTYDGKHHPGFNGKRFYRCRASSEAERREKADELVRQEDNRSMAAKQAFLRGGVFVGTD